MTVVTRFAPSPTGYLHIGGARTALFNWLFARHHGGKFLLRVEDTDRQRSTQEAIEAIFAGLTWLGLDWDGEAVFQFARSPRHAEVAAEMVARGHAYYCFTPQEEIDRQREEALANKLPFKFQSPWRNKTAADAPAGAKGVVRLKAPQSGEVVIDDMVQGQVRFGAEHLDDMVLLRSDGTPTYMLAVVVDDHDMGITHVIRGDDHLTNAARQALIYQAMGWEMPRFAHVPMIHGPDGAKLSKRHGALGVEAYRDMGFLPETMRNYLLRLGWAHGDDEIISTQQAIEWFNTDGMGKSPSRLDFAKLENLNGHYIREAENLRLLELLTPFTGPLDAQQRTRVEKGMNGLKQRAKTIKQLAELTEIYTTEPTATDDKAQAILAADESKQLLHDILPVFASAPEWKQPVLEEAALQFGEQRGLKLGKVAAPLRVALCGRTTAPSVFEMLEVFGKEESLRRLKAAA